MVANWIIQVIVAVVMAVLSYLITPRPDGQLSQAMEELEAPTAEPGRPIMWVFGTVNVKSLNTLWFGLRSRRVYKVKVGGKK